MRLRRLTASGGRRTIGPYADVAVVIGLSVASYLLRKEGLPWDGLWYDDAWVAGGAAFGSIGDIARTGGAHPGFTLLLRLQHQIIGGPVERLAFLTFVVGVVGPAVVYACLRSLRYARTSSLLAAAAVVVTPAHVIYSGRVKSYTLDVVVVVVVLLAAAIPRLASRRWTWWGSAGWVVVAVAAGSFSGFQMLASAVAIGVLVIHANGDRWRRAAALLVQGLLQGGWVVYVRRFVDLDEIEAFMEETYDAHVDRSGNPIELGQNLLRHLERVVDVHPGAPAAFLGIVAAAVLAGLVLGALGRLDHPRALTSQFALAALVLAAAGGVLHRFPFGPSTYDVSTVMGAPGARHGLWLVPVTAIGLCNLIDLAGRALGDRSLARTALGGAVLASTVLLVTSRWEPVVRGDDFGAHDLTRVADDAAAEGAYIVLDEMSSYQYLLLTDRPVRLEWMPEEMVGYLPVPDPTEGVVLGPVLTEPVVAEFVDSTPHDALVFVGMDIPHGDALRRAGWDQVRTLKRGGYRVTVWRRG